MKNADDMMKRILNEVDTNGDGKIQYEGTWRLMLCPKFLGDVHHANMSCRVSDLRWTG